MSDQKIRVVGIDPSLSRTGVCFGSYPGGEDVMTFSSKPCGDDPMNRISRCEDLVARINSLIAGLQPSVILLEGYAFGANDSRARYSAEFGGILRWHLITHAEVYEVAPGTLKKFGTGSGNCKKNLIMAHVQKRWGRMFNNDDECDAYILWRMALCAAGIVDPETKQQAEAVRKVIGCDCLDLSSTATSAADTF